MKFENVYRLILLPAFAQLAFGERWFVEPDSGSGSGFGPGDTDDNEPGDVDDPVSREVTPKQIETTTKPFTKSVSQNNKASESSEEFDPARGFMSHSIAAMKTYLSNLTNIENNLHLGNLIILLPTAVVILENPSMIQKFTSDDRVQYAQTIERVQFEISRIERKLLMSKQSLVVYESLLPLFLKNCPDKQISAIPESGSTAHVTAPQMGETPKAIEIHNEAIEYSAGGNYTAAYLKYQELAVINEKTLGPDHHSTLRAESNAGHMLTESGDLEIAYIALVGVLEYQKKSLGPNHPDTLRTEYFMGYNLELQDNDEAAHRLLRNVLAAQREVLGIKSIDTLRTQEAIGWILMKKRNYREAILTFRATLEGDKEILPAGHRYILRDEWSIANALIGEGKLEKARDILEFVIEKMVNTLGTYHPYTLAARQSLALVLYNQKNYAEVVTQETEDLVVAEVILGPENKEILYSQIRIGLSLYHMGKFRAACQILTELKIGMNEGGKYWPGVKPMFNHYVGQCSRLLE